MTEPEVDPIERFSAWLREAEAAEPVNPNAMAVATVAADGMPSARTVLLKGVDRDGFVFYTNLESQKGQELLARPMASLCFYWKALRRQVRIDGMVSTVSDAEADAYFASRPRDSQIGAWASAQSRPLGSREELIDRVAEVERRFDGRPVPRPAFWSGFRVAPRRVEFWTERPHRLHDREVYERAGGGWRCVRVYP